MSETNYIHIIYETINSVNEKIYIGKHKQHGVEFDGYLGSGLMLQRAIEKYGESFFSRKTLFVFDNAKDAFVKEAEIVNDDFIKREDNYNICVGGYGGDRNSGKKFTPDHCEKMRQAKLGTKHSQETKDKIKAATSGPNNIMYGKTHTAAARAKISKANKGLVRSDEFKAKISASTKGAKNHFFGKKHSPETLKLIGAKVSAANTGRKYEIVKCPHCDKEGGLTAMKRWHFDNCRSK